ncbi:MAG: PQQ-binding-like beta-propeller repeat protein [Planctomycetaceae bacterium]
MTWSRTLSSAGLGGIAATADCVIVSDRELDDTVDVFRGFDATTGREKWTVRYLAPSRFDYGNSPRATPLVDGDRVFLFGASGHLTCANVETGKVLWRLNVVDEFNVSAELPWGFCGSPLIVNEQLVLGPGGEEGAVVALDPATGDVRWATTGNSPSYGSLIEMTINGSHQIVGHDSITLGGWDTASGKRLWTLAPQTAKDFHVPTPIVFEDKLVVSTENNGTCLYRFSEEGRLEPEPVAVFRKLAPDTHTPVISGRRLLGVCKALYCLDLDNNLSVVWRATDEAFRAHVSLLADDRRLLAWTEAGELLLVDAQAEEYRVLDRYHVFPGESGLLSHPALVGDTLYVRGNSEIRALSLAP